MAKETKFLNGFRVFSPRESAPDFVKGEILINSMELIGAIQALGQDVIRLDIKESLAGNLYASINEYQKPAPAEDAFSSVESESITGIEEMF